MRFYTHDSEFHIGEVAAYAIMETAGFDMELHRQSPLFWMSGNDAEYGEDMIVELGGQYDPENLMYDARALFGGHEHPCMRDNGIRYGTAGLIWEDWGGEAILNHISRSAPENGTHTHSVFERMQNGFICGIDFEDGGRGPKNSRGKNVWTLADAVSAYNSNDHGDECFQEMGFLMAVEFMKRLLKTAIDDALDMALMAEPSLSVLSDPINSSEV